MGSALAEGLLAAGWCAPERASRSSQPSREAPARRSARASRACAVLPGPSSSATSTRRPASCCASSPTTPRRRRARWRPLGLDAAALGRGGTARRASRRRSCPVRVAVVRSMPNTPVLVRTGVSAIAGGAHVTEADLDWAESILGAVGTRRARHRALTSTRSTGLSRAPMPAYLYLVVEALIEAGVHQGLVARRRARLVVGTFEGSAALLVATGESPEELRAQVTSPGGVDRGGTAHARGPRGARRVPRGGRRRGRAQSPTGPLRRSSRLGPWRPRVCARGSSPSRPSRACPSTSASSRAGATRGETASTRARSASCAGVTATTVRRDLAGLGSLGHARRGLRRRGPHRAHRRGPRTRPRLRRGRGRASATWAAPSSTRRTSSFAARTSPPSTTTTRRSWAPRSPGHVVRHLDEGVVARHRRGDLRAARAPPRRWPTASSRADIHALLNFAPQVIAVPLGTAVHYVDFSIELQILMYHLNNGTGPARRRTPALPGHRARRRARVVA